MGGRLLAVLDDLTERLRICDGPGLDRGQRLFLLRDFRQDLADQVDDAEHRGISERGAARLMTTRSMIRWLERGELPGPDAVPLLERMLASIARNTDERELAERETLVAAIHDLGGDDRAAAGIWREPAEDDPEALAAYGRALHGLMLAAGLTVAELATRADLEPRPSLPTSAGPRKRGSSRPSGYSTCSASRRTSSPRAWTTSAAIRRSRRSTAG